MADMMACALLYGLPMTSTHRLPRSTRIALWLVAGLSVVVAPRGFMSAQEMPDVAPQREMLLFEEPVITTAAKRQQAVSEAPAAVSIITREDIRRFGYRTLAEALRSLRGFYSSYDRSYDYIGVRGFLLPGDYNNRILLLVNGHTYNNDVYGQAPVGFDFGIDMEAIERIEVVRGPGSSLYGGNAMFAVINVITAGAQELPGVRPLFEVGSLGRLRGQISAGHVFANGIEVFASGSIVNIDGHDELYFPVYQAPETNNGIAVDADGEQAYDIFVSARYGELFLQGGANRREKNIPTGAFDTTFNDNDTAQVDERWFAEVQYTLRDVLPKFQASARLFYDGYRYKGTFAYGTGSDKYNNEDLAVSHWLGAELRAEYELFAQNYLVAGAEFTYNPDLHQQNYDVPGPTLLDDERTYNTWGVYAEDEWMLPYDVTLLAGVRFDRYYDRFQQASPRVALMWKPRPPTNIKLLFGQAFRAPSPFELYYQVPSPPYIYVADPNIKPETITTYEAVLEQDLWYGVEAAASVYFWDLHDLIALEPVSGVPDTYAYQNSGDAHATGFELEVRVPLPHNINANASYSFQDARRAGGERLTNSPQNLGHLGLLFPLPFGVVGGAEMDIVGPRKTLQGSDTSTATIANLTLNYATPLKGLGTSVGFYNLFDQNYADPGGPDLQENVIRQNGFTFRVQVQYAF